MRTIARIKNLALRRKVYLPCVNHQYTTHDLEIVKYNDNGETCYTVANFNDQSEIVSCGERLFNAIDVDNLEDFKVLLEIARIILVETEETKIGD